MHTETFASSEVAFFAKLADYGYEPAVVYDIGAANGSWSGLVSAVFSGADYHLFEPLAKSFPKYTATMASHLQAHSNFTLHPVALGAKTQMSTFHLTPEGYDSSLLPMNAPEIRKVQVPCWRLDEYAARHKLPPPNLIKIDVQGVEHLVLQGAGNLVKQADLLHLETWLYRGYGPGTVLLAELIAMLTPLDFVLVHIGNPYYGDYRRLTSIDGFFLSKRLLDELKAPSNGWNW